MIREIVLPDAPAAIVERAARSALPREYCAALLGCTDGARAEVTDVVRLRNSDTRPGRFAVPDAELRRAERLAHGRDRVVVALLHTHPRHAPQPSACDLGSLLHARHPWVIAALGTPGRADFAAYTAGTATPLRISTAT